MRFLQFNVKSVLIATAACAVGLTVWKSYGSGTATTWVILPAATVLLVRISLYYRQSVLFAMLLGSSLWGTTGLVAAFYEDWMFSYALEEHSRVCMIGASIGLVCTILFKLERRASWFDFSTRRLARPSISTLAMLIFFGLTFYPLDILDRHKAMDPNANFASYGSENGLQVYKYWGQGINDVSFAKWSKEIPQTGKHIFRFRHTSISDRSAKRLAQFSNTVELDIRGTQISSAGVRLLREALPACKIRR